MHVRILNLGLCELAKVTVWLVVERSVAMSTVVFHLLWEYVLACDVSFAVKDCNCNTEDLIFGLSSCGHWNLEAF